MNDYFATPCVAKKSIDIDNITIHFKLESHNLTGSVKDRAAMYIIEKLLKKKTINSKTKIIESSSGNFGIALAACCKLNGLDFYCVIDPNILPINEFLIYSLGANVIKVTEPDKEMNYLNSRISRVQDFIKENDNSYWVNQYENPLNVEAYCNSLGNEVCDQVPGIDYVFIGVSSGGTIAGLSRKVKERYSNAKIIAVDVKGSIIFGGHSGKRYIPGIGAARVPKNLDLAIIDDICLVWESDVVKYCHKLLREYQIFAGGSSGAVLAAIYNYFANKVVEKEQNIVAIIPDRGERYYSTIYNREWCCAKNLVDDITTMDNLYYWMTD